MVDRTRNPFRPSFGTTPPVLAGRDVLAAVFGDALDDGPGAPGRATLYTGARGVGKTVMLNEAEAQAKERGWVVISETATKGLVTRMTNDHLPYLAGVLGLEETDQHITGVTLPMGLGGITRKVEEEPTAPRTLRRQMDAITDHLHRNGTGLLITLDEVHAGDKAELRELGAAIQHAFREERQVAFVAAGLPAAVDDLLADRVLTFLRRAERHHLGPVDLPDASDAIRRPIEDAGRHIDAEALAAATAATGGYPFLIQLIGYHTWLTSDRGRYDSSDVAEGIVRARARLGALTYEPAVRDLSPTDRAFLYAMLADVRPDGTGESAVADIAERMEVSGTYVSQYRLRLIGSDLIRSSGRGRVEFAMPYFAEYLREHADRWRP